MSHSLMSPFAIAQPSVSSPEKIKELLANTKEALRSGNTTDTIDNLLMVQRMITQINDNSSSIEESKLLIRETVGTLLNGKLDIATTNLDLINKLLFEKPPDNATSDTINRPLKPVTPVQPTLTVNITSTADNMTSKEVTSPLEDTTPSIQSALPSNVTSENVNNNGTEMNLRTYESRVFGIKIQYPDSWSARGYSYNKAGNNTVVGFYSPSKTASQLGNISGVSGQFIPYLDIFVFDSKNMSLDKVINGRINRIQNTTDIILDTKPFTLKGNQPAHMLVYTTITGGDEFFEKMQVYTITSNKVYLLTFTAQEALFSKYLPVVQNMIDSFEISAKFSS